MSESLGFRDESERDSAVSNVVSQSKGNAVINKKNLLGKSPIELGDKDAIHVAIVSVRAGKPVSPGERCKLNEYREAVPAELKDCVGVADPFLRRTMATGEKFWLLLCQDEVPNVQHVWEHPTVDFSPPIRETEKCKYLQRYADQFGVTYEQLMDAAAKVADDEEPPLYPGTKTEEEVESLIESDEIDVRDLWSWWADEVGHEFYNVGTECCPKYEYPENPLFRFSA